MKYSRILSILSLLGVLFWASPANGQDYYDDDIYYNASKQPKKTATQTKTSNNAATAAGTYYVPNVVTDYPAADSYAVMPGQGLNVDVDAYNRRGQFLVPDSVGTDSASVGEKDSFAYTRRLERFYNPEVVSASGDDELMTYYYSDASTTPTTVNVYVYDNPWWPGGYYGPWGPSWGFGWNSWGWNVGFYDPWWGPYYGWNWGWGPSYAWGPAWGWGWGPSYAWGWGPGWGPGWGWGSPGYLRPANPGSAQAHRPVYAGGSHSPAGNRYLGGSNLADRPGYIGNVAGGGSGNHYNVPTATPQGSRPGNGAAVPSNNNQRPNNNPTYNNNRGRNNNSYNNSSSSPSRSSFGGGSSYGGGSRGGGSGFGGGSRGGGGGSRGRR